MPDYVLAFIIALVVAYILTPRVISLANKTGALDAPDARKVHSKPIPRIGGLAIYFAFIVAAFFTVDLTKEVIGLLTGATVILIVGIIDDFKSLPAKVKLVGQILAAVVLVLFDVKTAPEATDKFPFKFIVEVVAAAVDPLLLKVPAFTFKSPFML